MEHFRYHYDVLTKGGQNQPPEERWMWGNVSTIMEEFCRQKPVEAFPFEAIGFEEVKGVKLAEDDHGELVFWVKRDLVGKEKGSGLLVPIDHKTTHKLTTWWALTHKNSSQLSGYCWFCGEEYGVPVNVAYVNGVEVGQLPNSTRKCSVHGKKYSECGRLHANFQVYRVPRSDGQIAAWKRDAINLAKKARFLQMAFTDVRMLPAAGRQGAFNEHCRFCEMQEWCLLGFEAGAMEGCVVYDPWRPWELEGARRIDL
jgi:hypothetical protein